MISYEIYKLIHFIGLTLTVFSLGALAFQMHNHKSADFKNRKYLGIGHGLGLFLLLLGGFGMLARLGLAREMPTWVWIKLTIWLLIGALIAPLRRKPEWSHWLWAVGIFLVSAAAWVALFKPFL